MTRQEKRQQSLRRRGLISDKPFEIRWKVSANRKDTRTGPTKQTRRSAYAQKLYDTMMRKWR